MTSQLTNRALLVSLNISQWAARKLDKEETRQLAVRHGTLEGAARVNKSLLPTSKALDAIHKKTGHIRTEFYKRSLGWGQEGVRIIKSEGYLDFVKEFSTQKNEFNNLVTTFVAEYPAAQQEAQALLGPMYKAEDYPDALTIHQRFNMDIGFFPVPTASDWRISLADDEITDLQKQIEARVMESQASAMKEAWQRIADVVTKAHERLSDPDNIFRDSLVDNARELCDILPSLNIADDPEMEKIRQALQGSLCTTTPEALRTDMTARSHVNAALKDIMDKMGAMYG